MVVTNLRQVYALTRCFTVRTPVQSSRTAFLLRFDVTL